MVLGAACGSGTKSGDVDLHDDGGARRCGLDVPGLGTGVTAGQIKLGVTLIDYKCIPATFVDSVYVNQPQAYNAFIDDINENGGINGRKIVPVFKYICPLAAHGRGRGLHRRSPTTARCSRSIGSMYDPTGDAQLCVAKQHNTVLITDGLSQDMIDKAPPGAAAHAGHHLRPPAQGGHVAARSRGTCSTDKTVAVLTETSAKDRVKTVVQPALEAMTA